MQKSLREEFEASQRWPWWTLALWTAAIGVAVTTWALWPPATLRHALADVDEKRLALPYRNRALQGAPFTSWNWVDASRRPELAASMSKAGEAVDVMLRLAEGRAFLFYPSSTQAFVPTARGPVFVTNLGWEKTNGIARDVRGGPVLDLKPFKVTPTVVAVPADTLMDYVTADGSGDWRFFATYEGQRAEDNRNRWRVHDPVAALTFLRRAAP